MVEGGHYGTFDICVVCGWEDDGVQLANPACGGGANKESLIDAQVTALAKVPLNVATLASFVRDGRWRPLNNAECESAVRERETRYWLNKAIWEPEQAYWNRISD